MDESRLKRTLDFILSSYRAKMAVQSTSAPLVFDFTAFLNAWNDIPFHDLRITMLRDAELLIEHGLFDSIASYLDSSIIRHEKCKIVAKSDHKSNSDLTASLVYTSSSLKNRPKRENSSEDYEIIIHVCDEAKGTQEDFRCSQSMLLNEMGYFSKVVMKGQKLKDMDISVHCDIFVFRWLITWAQYHSRISAAQNSSSCLSLVPVNNLALEPTNVISLLVSADFLQMSQLASECLQFIYDNMGQVINHSPNLGCLSEHLASRLVKFFSNFEIETRIMRLDRGDRVTSRLYMQLILNLNELEADNGRGHYASTATLFRCLYCGQLLINNVASKVRCTNMEMDSRGRIFSIHKKDKGWTLANFIKDLKRELKTWRRVYWRLWATIHYLFCSTCEQYFPAKHFTSCAYHKEDLQFLTKIPEKPPKPEKQRRERHLVYINSSSDSEDEEPPAAPIIFPYGEYPCCKQPAYLFYPLPALNGCSTRDHSLDEYGEDDPVIKIMTAFKDLIFVPYSEKERKKLNVDWTCYVNMMPMQPSLPQFWTSSFDTFKTPASSSPQVATLLNKMGTALPQDGKKLEQQKSTSSDDSSCTVGAKLDSSQEELNSSHSIKMAKKNVHLHDSWIWNPDFTTRYNQDMQREKEEKLMMELEALLSQNLSVDGASSSKMASNHLRTSLFGTNKSNAGSYIKLEEKWREEIQKRGVCPKVKKN